MASRPDEVLLQLAAKVEGIRLECHALKIGKVQHPFHLPYPKDTLTVLVISTPSMFEQLFLPL